MFRTLLATALIGLSAAPAAAEIDSGAYLAARQAQALNDFRQIERYLGRSMLRDPGDAALMEALIGAQISLGEFKRAAEVARKLISEGGQSQIANLALVATAAKAGEWSDILEDLEAGISVGPLFDELLRAWALLGDGETEASLAAFDSVAAEPGLRAFGLYHKALALASLGRFEEAAAVLDETDSIQLTRRGVIAHAQILSQIGRFDDALSVLDEGFPDQLDGSMTELRAGIAAEEPQDFTIAPDPVAGVAEVAYDIAGVVIEDAAGGYALLYPRLTEYLRPDHTEAILLSAAILDELGQHDLAVENFARIEPDDPAYVSAELGRAEVLRKSGDTEGAIAVMRALAERPDAMPIVHVTLGDTLRDLDRYEEALEAYDAALEKLGGSDPETLWIVHFSRGVTQERLGNWKAAEADFRRALELNEGQPQVLNYLGYSLVERHEELDEALAMIERAAEARPDSGYIVDSLGWALYRLGRYREAVEPMERAVELMPVDPVVNDHLGDVYWTVGRKLEARFQWNRALSFVENDESGEVDAERIRRKLEVGLDAVLEEEGAPPIQLSNEG